MRLGIVVLLASCGIGDSVDQGDFAEVGAALVCSRMRECSTGEYRASYFGRADCRRHWEQALWDELAFRADEGCSYVGAGAAAALEAIDDMACDEFYEQFFVGTAKGPFDDAWSGCGGGGDQ
jgi:hypothetical protein